ncbi:MAG: histidine kinase [Actinobacteria bacterium]|nr:histidine kinase [Actinomycetota bacterium]
MTTTTPAAPSRSQRRAVTASQARLLDVGVWLASCVPVVASPFLDRSDLRWIDAVVALVALALLLVRRRWPIPTLATGLIAAVIATAVVGRPTAMLPATVFLLYNVAVGTDRRTTIRAGVAGLVALVVCVVIIASNEILGPELLAGLAWPALAVAAGDAVRSRREAIAAAEERAARAEATREEEARRRVAEERLHIARELHDVVAHQIAVINVQAGVAAHLLTDHPDQAIEALGTVRSSARHVLEELSNILGVLRTNDDPTAATSPAPTMHDLPALIESYERAGLHVTFDTSGDDHPVGDATAIAVYRTIQEGLTNAHRHGDGNARVRLTRHRHEIELVITNRVANRIGRETAPGAGPGSGFGLIGMRERVHAAGGTLTTGAGPDGTFTVDARFPISRDQGDE